MYSTANYRAKCYNEKYKNNCDYGGRWYIVTFINNIKFTKLN